MKTFFPRSDKRAIIVLAVVATLLVGIRLGMGFVEGERTAQHNDLSTANDSIMELLAVAPFDPNTVDSLTLIAHGLTPYQAKSLIHYRNTGAVFRSADDLSHLYGWDDSDVNRLRAFIRVDAKFNKRLNSPKRHSDSYRHVRSEQPHAGSSSRYYPRTDTTYVAQYPASNKFTSPTRIDINTADSATLIRIPGMGEKSVSALLRLRQRLGGFVATEQILDIRFINPQVLEWLKVSDSPSVRLIYINLDDFRTINAHPYISYEQTKDIVNCRRQQGCFESADALLQTHIFTAEQLERLLPYLSFATKRD